MKSFLFLVFVAGVSISNALPTDKKSKDNIDKELNGLERLIQERVLGKEVRDENEEYRELEKDEENRELEENEETKKLEEDKENRELEEALSSLRRGILSPKSSTRRQRKQQRQTSSEEESNAEKSVEEREEDVIKNL